MMLSNITKKIARGLSPINIAILLTLIAALFSYYFSISRPLLRFMVPDEVSAFQLYEAFGLLGCIEYYFTETTINRLAAVSNACVLGNISVSFEQLWQGWVVSRGLMYSVFSLVLLLFIRYTLRVKWWISAVSALTISSVSFYIILDHAHNLNAIDLAIYVLYITSLIGMINSFSNAHQNTSNFLLFATIFFINLNSHEIALVISGFIIPLYAFEHLRSDSKINKIKTLIITSWKSTHIWALSVIYIFSAAITLLAPGVAMRQELWPSSGTWYEGFVNAILLVEEVLFLLSEYYLLVLIVILFGVLSRLSSPKNSKPNKTIIAFMVISPFICLFLIGYLVGLTPNLWSLGIRSESFRIFESLVPPATENLERLYEYGSVTMRQFLPIYIGFCINLYLIGYYLGGKVTTTFPSIAQANITKTFVVTASLVVSVFIGFVHIGGYHSLKALNVIFLDRTYNMEKYLKEREEFTENFSIAQALASNSNVLFSKVSQSIFVRHFRNEFFPVLANPVINRYLVSRKGRYDDVNIYDVMDIDAKKYTMYAKHFYKKYEIVGLAIACNPLFTSFPLRKGDVCKSLNLDQSVTKVLDNQKLASIENLSLVKLTNLEARKSKNKCTILLDKKDSDGFHMATTKLLELKKGLHYFSLETETTLNETIIPTFMLEDRSQILLPWLNNSKEKMGTFTNYIPASIAEPVYIHTESRETNEVFAFIINAKKDLKATINWVHSDNGQIVYKGAKVSSKVCSASYAPLLNINQ